MHSYKERRRGFSLSSMLRTTACVIFPPIIFAFLLFAFACLYYYIHFTLINPTGNPNSHFAGDSTTKSFTLFNGAEAVVHYHEAESNTEYTVLDPGALLVGEVVRNPALGSVEACFLDEDELARHAFPSVRRYVLHNTVKGRRYELHISYPGSPPIGFHLLLYHVRASSVLVAGSARNASSGEPPRDAFADYRTPQGSSHELLDTEVRMITMDHARCNQYNPQQTIHYDLKDLLGLIDGNDSNNVVGVLNDAPLGEPEEDPFVAVVEVRPYVLALSSKSPCLFPEIVYNIQLEDLVGNLLPVTIIPTIVGITAIMLFSSSILYFIYQKGFLITSSGDNVSAYEIKFD